MTQADPLWVKMTVVGQVTHVRCKVMYRCVYARHCPVETDTQQGYQRAENRQTNLGSYSIPTDLMSLSHDRIHAITSYLDNKVICDWPSTFGCRWIQVTNVRSGGGALIVSHVRLVILLMMTDRPYELRQEQTTKGQYLENDMTQGAATEWMRNAVPRYGLQRGPSRSSSRHTDVSCPAQCSNNQLTSAWTNWNQSNEENARDT